MSQQTFRSKNRKRPATQRDSLGAIRSPQRGSSALPAQSSCMDCKTIAEPELETSLDKAYKLLSDRFIPSPDEGGIAPSPDLLLPYHLDSFPTVRACCKTFCDPKTSIIPFPSNFPTFFHFALFELKLLSCLVQSPSSGHSLSRISRPSINSPSAFQSRYSTSKYNTIGSSEFVRAPSFLQPTSAKTDAWAAYTELRPTSAETGRIMPSNPSSNGFYRPTSSDGQTLASKPSTVSSLATDKPRPTSQPIHPTLLVSSRRVPQPSRLTKDDFGFRDRPKLLGMMWALDLLRRRRASSSASALSSSSSSTSNSSSRPRDRSL
ncbi:hypothetical protein CROQUDRAFT_87137 [Cronartium quercuum f. sp. fusiforme G11]|uniref:Uncharacterized protein n=1 Tax=Cronartium quercuum f. sp. fusiforme G11 TaxID=708437 RepID=A0A9P6TFT8_9BASI|nr:hypothetical protein CROQUDRAFT_87137 [Cronartium quercuum f. sp. fusiforme G11]